MLNFRPVMSSNSMLTSFADSPVAVRQPPAGVSSSAPVFKQFSQLAIVYRKRCIMSMSTNLRRKQDNVLNSNNFQAPSHLSLRLSSIALITARHWDFRPWPSAAAMAAAGRSSHIVTLREDRPITCRFCKLQMHIMHLTQDNSERVRS